MKRVIGVLTVLLLFFLLILPTQALSLEKQDMSKQEHFLSVLDLTLLTAAPPNPEIDSFGVNKKGDFVICSSNGERKMVAVYSPSGRFQYGYRFKAGGNMGVEFDGDDLMIYFVRGGSAVKVDSDGNVLEIYDFPNTVENLSYWRNTIFVKTKTVGDRKYSLKHGKKILYLLDPVFRTQLVVEDKDGNATVLYDADRKNTILGKYILIDLGILTFITVIVVSFVRTVKKINSMNH